MYVNTDSFNQPLLYVCLLVNGSALGPTALQRYNTSKDLDMVIAESLQPARAGSAGDGLIERPVLVDVITVGQPIRPMLARPVSSTANAMAKFPQGFYAEIKYDGERVQVHSCANEGVGAGTRHASTHECTVFSRSLKFVKDDKICNWKHRLGCAFPNAKSMILDCEVLMVDTKENVFLPFGTLGSQKRHEFPNAQPCAVVFDMLMYNDRSLLSMPMHERRTLLETVMNPINHLVMLSAITQIDTEQELDAYFSHALAYNEEGIMIKDKMGLYEPGKRRWFKLKRDYIVGENKTESVDLAVLGGYFGRGAKGNRST